jgi:DNA-binding CsgD family transcriptional regulator
VSQLVAEGFSRQAIAAAAGISARTIVASVLETRKQLGRRTSDAILGLTRADIARKTDPTSLLPAIGAARRLQALMRMGWRMSDLAADKTEYHLINKVRTAPDHRIKAQSWLRIAEMYAQREMTPGPHKGNATKGKRFDYAPPLAWDDIDDPTATPNFDGDEANAGRLALYLTGLSDIQIAVEEKVSRDAIRVWRKRNGLEPNYKPRGRNAS